LFKEINSAPGKAPALPLSWIETWWNALVQPSVTTYLGFANDPRASSHRAYKWVVRTAIVAGILLAFGQYGPDFGALCLGPIFAALLSLASFALVAGFSHAVAKAVGGTGTYAKLAYATAAYFVPLSLITTAVGAIAAISLLNYPLWLYGFILNIVATKAVHQLSWGRAAIASVILATLSAMAFAVVVIVLVALQL
jgi:hypothetical protein